MSHTAVSDNWTVQDNPDGKGTEFRMLISLPSDRTLHDIFARFTEEEDLRFEITEIPVSLAQMGEDNLVSRSQAKRLLSRVTDFRKAILDFSGVKSIGPAFSDEIFRVFAENHPEVSVEYSNASTEVEKMVRRAMSARRGEGSGDGAEIGLVPRGTGAR